MGTVFSAISTLDASSHRSGLDAVPEDGVPRPLWSVMIPSHNCAKYLRETLASVLAQAPGPEQMQIEVVDDCSHKDDPEAVVREVGQGRVVFHRQPKNVGHTGNFETCLQRSRGYLIHLLHGDDAVRPGFYTKMGAALREHPEIGAAFSRQIFIDEHGNWTYLSPMELSQSGIIPDILERLAVAQRIQTPSIVVRRRVYEELGSFDRRLSWTEDWEMWARIAANYPVWHELEPLALYRVHTSSNTGTYMQTGENVRDLARLFSILETYVPGKEGQALVRRGRNNYSRSALTTAEGMLRNGNFRSALAQAWQAIRLSPRPGLVWPLLHLVVVAGKQGLKKNLRKKVPASSVRPGNGQLRRDRHTEP